MNASFFFNFHTKATFIVIFTDEVT